MTSAGFYSPALTGRRRSIAAACALALVLAACAETPKPGLTPIAQAPVAAIPAREHIARAVDMLGQGQQVQARAEVEAALAEQPANGRARSLLDQIDKDPKVLLGERNYPYRVRPGETFSVLAERFLGDPMLFYALARYNNIDAPSGAVAGQVLRIPGVPKRAAPSHPAQAQSAPPAQVATVALRDPARASRLRGVALEDMSRGTIDHAVAVLRQALQFDPGNALITRDLDRAVRIQTAVRR